MVNKKCTKCLISKSKLEFHKRSDKKDKLSNFCKSCKSANSRLYYNNNLCKITKRNKEYKLKNWEQHLETCRRWNKNNKGRKNYLTAKRRSKIAQASPSWLDDFDKDYMKFIYITAKEMSKMSGSQFHVDHIQPLRGSNVCGLHVPWNLQIIPSSENLKKGNRVI